MKTGNGKVHDRRFRVRGFEVRHGIGNDLALCLAPIELVLTEKIGSDRNARKAESLADDACQRTARIVVSADDAVDVGMFVLACDTFNFAFRVGDPYLGRWLLCDQFLQGNACVVMEQEAVPIRPRQGCDLAIVALGGTEEENRAQEVFFAEGSRVKLETLGAWKTRTGVGSARKARTLKRARHPLPVRRTLV